ncbi:MAG: DUF72 domain-containing protein [bacterium]|nr:DUF72 domain-containing protein [bacterium]
MEIYVGTSGWLYSWNEEKSFDWYVENSKLNSVELNASFYRFPYPNQIKGWANKSKNIYFAIKVHRKVTHVLKLTEESKQVWNDFKNIFIPLKEKIVFYLFQMPPSFSPEFFNNIEVFFSDLEEKGKFAIEFRHKGWFDEKWVKRIEKLGLIFVSIDSPEIKSFIVKTNGVIYLRFHGRNSWYSHNYTEEELNEIANKIKDLKPKKIFAYFNNNHNMLSNAQKFYKILKE